MIFCIFYNIVNIACWCGLADRFGHWWIALFAIFTMIHSSKKVDDGGNENGCND